MNSNIKNIVKDKNLIIPLYMYRLIPKLGIDTDAFMFLMYLHNKHCMVHSMRALIISYLFLSRRSLNLKKSYKPFSLFQTDGNNEIIHIIKQVWMGNIHYNLTLTIPWKVFCMRSIRVCKYLYIFYRLIKLKELFLNFIRKSSKQFFGYWCLILVYLIFNYPCTFNTQKNLSISSMKCFSCSLFACVSFKSIAYLYW